MSFSRSSLRKAGVVAAVTLVAATFAASSPASAAPFAMAQVTSSVDASGSGANCSASSASDPSPTTITTNAPTKTVSYTATRSVTTTSDASDVTALSLKNTAHLRVTAADGYPKTIDLSFAGTAIRTNSAGHATSACQSSGVNVAVFQAKVDLLQPGLVTISNKLSGAGVAEIEFTSPSGSNPGNEAIQSFPNSSATSTVFLPAGNYVALIAGGVNLPEGDAAQSVSASGSFHVAFTRGGSRLSGPSGGGRSYVTLGAARSCAAHTLVSHVTANKASASKIRSVSIMGNGHLLKRVNAPKAGAAVTATMPAGKAENVKAVVVLRSGQKLSATASYLNCS